MAGTRFVVVGGGIVGLATAHRIRLERPDAQVTVLEKEQTVGAHQTGHNSGVIHAGVYYQPGSLKARLSRAGSRSMVDFCRENEIPVAVCGKLIAATTPSELERLRALHERAVANGLEVSMLSAEQAAQFEPHLSCVAAMRVATTAITDFGLVSQALAKIAGTVKLGCRVTGIRPDGRAIRVETTAGDLAADVLVNCAGLHADRVARMAGVEPGVRIVPFRGEYYELRPERRDLVRGLIYPVPDPRFPFLGVHFTRMIDGSVHAGPNAVLAFAREGYRWSRINARDLAEIARFGGMWRLAGKHWLYGLGEVRRSLSGKRFAASLARLVPSVTLDDLIPCAAGVRAQAITRSGDLVDDFLIEVRPGQVHVLNAPSPAATSSLEIAKHIYAQLP